MPSRLVTRSATVAVAKITIALALFAGATRASAQAQQFYSVTPCRVVDTRNGYGGIVVASTLRTFTIKGGTCGVATDAKSVALNATVITPSVEGFVFFWPSNLGIPQVSNMNFTAGTPALANGVIVGLYSGTPDLAMAYGTGNGSGQLHLVLDVTGYFK